MSLFYRPWARCVLGLLALFVCVPLLGQSESTIQREDLPEYLKRQFIPRTFMPKIRAKKKGLLSAGEWRQRIDEAWGESHHSTEERLAIFDIVWQKVDGDFACFQDLALDWQALHDTYRPEVAAGVSRGRFAAIMNHLVLPLKEAHTQVNDILVNFRTQLIAGTPLLQVGGWGRNGHFGAALTPLPDRSLLVYSAVENHPLGLVPGDIVLGYEGRPWHELYPELIAAELPITGFWWGSSPSAYEHSWLMSAGLNWHLFDTIDIRKFASGETLQLNTHVLATFNGELFGTEQLPVAGVPMDPLNGLTNSNPVSWGLIDGTRIGYIYVWAWTGNAGTLFEEAVRELTLEMETDGLIIDFRTNLGGNMLLSNPALSILFNKPVDTIGFIGRKDPSDHLSFETVAEPSIYTIPGDPETYFNKPIAVLVGPGAVSSGDQVALRMKFHPRVRLFGKSTTAAFNAPLGVTPHSDFSFRVAVADAFLVSNPNVNLTHDEFEVDESVWLTPEDVAEGKDTVVAAALTWIAKELEPCESSRWIGHVTSANGGFTTQVLIANGATEEERVVLAPYDIEGNALTQVALLVPGNGTAQNFSSELFRGEPVSHFSICAPETVIVSVAYRTATLDGGSAHVHENQTAKTSFRLYPGQLDYTFDGMALVNLGDDATSVRVRLLDFSGNEIAMATLNEALPSRAKQLVVFESVFAAADEGMIVVETDQPATAIFLRGTRNGVAPSYLYQNNGLPDAAAPQSEKR